MRIPTRLLTSSLAAAALAAGAAGCGSSSDDDTASTAAAAAPASTTSSTSASDTIVVDAKDFAFDKSSLTAKAGKVTIELKNMGKAPHELVVLKTDAAPDSLEVGDDGTVAEDDSVGEVEEVDGGGSGTHTFDLQPGKYVYVCNVPGHYGDGMRGQLTVR